MVARRRKPARQANVTAERNLPAVLAGTRFEMRPFFIEKANGDRFAAMRLYALVALYYGYLHGVCADDRMNWAEGLQTWNRCQARPAKTWCQYHGQSFGPSVTWSEASRSEREYAKAIAAELS